MQSARLVLTDNLKSPEIDGYLFFAPDVNHHIVKNFIVLFGLTLLVCCHRHREAIRQITTPLASASAMAASRLKLSSEAKATPLLPAQ